MEKYKVYKDLDTPCKIRGMYNHYFYIFFVSGLFTVMLAFTSLSSLLRGNTVFSFCVELFFELIIPISIYCVFYKLSNRPKMKLDRSEITLSNRDLYKSLQ